jgi:hypothetical protein
VADLPADLAKVLAELEARKRSLQSRMHSIDSAIQSIQGLQTSYSHEELPAEPVEELPVREELANALEVTAQPQLAPGESNDFVLQPEKPYYGLLEKEKALSRPIVSKAEPERSKSARLNVYVNQNSEWASKQLVSPKSRRATFRHKTGQRCPKCGSQDTRLSVTKGLADCFMFLFDYSLARCRNCDTKFRIWRTREDEDDDRPEKQLGPHPTD